MPTLIIAEKPSVARGIADAVGAHERRDGYIEGGGYLISWCRGHIIDLDFPQNYPQWSGHWSMSQLPMIPERWRWSVTAPEQYKVLKGLLDRADVELVVNACDADREGEGIFRRVWTHSGCKKPVRRFWSTSLVPEQVRTDLAHAKPLPDYDGLADAAEGRAKADWLVGLNASRALSCLYEGSRLSAGRVQTPTLALVVERTRAIRGFKSVPFFQVECSVGRTAHVRLAGEKLKTRQEAERRAHAAVGSQCAILKVERRQEKYRAPKLYDLTGLQRDASTRAGLTAEETLNALQTLYEKKLATYPRTESRYIGESDIPETARVLSAIAVPGIVGEAAAAGFDASRSDVARVADDSKVHGHGAILPTALLDAKEMAALAGACIGFLWFNSFPADIFMGDTGSLALGMALGCLAVFTKSEFIVLVIGGLFVAEALSVMIQVFYYKKTHKRIFLMAPLHHHFEKKGWSETKVVVRFWIVSGVLAALGFAVYFAETLMAVA